MRRNRVEKLRSKGIQKKGPMPRHLFWPRLQFRNIRYPMPWHSNKNLKFEFWQKHECCGIHNSMPQHSNCTKKKFGSQYAQCRSIEYPMPRHSSVLKKSGWSPRHEYRSIQYLVSRHSLPNLKKKNKKHHLTFLFHIFSFSLNLIVTS